MKHKIFVVDDHPIMRQGYAALINRELDLQVCGEAEGALDALDAISKAAADLVIVDISLVGMNGIELIKRLQDVQPGLPTLVVSMHDGSRYVERALRAGARGYVMKKEVYCVLIEAIRKILNGGFYLSEEVSTKILLQYTGSSIKTEAALFEGLSDRELEVFEMLGRGLTTRQIAEALLISPKTVESHRGRIKRKMGLESTAELLKKAVRWVRPEETT